MSYSPSLGARIVTEGMFDPLEHAANPMLTHEIVGKTVLGISPDAKVTSYLGSFGSWYMVDEMLDFFRVQLERDPAAVFLIITRETSEVYRCYIVRPRNAANRALKTEPDDLDFRPVPAVEVRYHPWQMPAFMHGRA